MTGKNRIFVNVRLDPVSSATLDTLKRKSSMTTVIRGLIEKGELSSHSVNSKSVCQIGVELTPGMLSRLDSLCATYGINRTQVIRRLLHAVVGDKPRQINSAQEALEAWRAFDECWTQAEHAKTLPERVVARGRAEQWLIEIGRWIKFNSCKNAGILAEKK